jgi:hypothetical protein
MSALPVVQYGTVTGTFLAAAADGGDDDALPEGFPLSGQVSFTPEVSSLIVKSANPPLTVLPAKITADLDAGGYISLNGVRGVTLLASDDPNVSPTNFTYRVEFTNLRFTDESNNATPVSYKAFSIKVPAGTNTDLSVVAPVQSDAGTVTVSNEVAVMQARTDTFAARDAAVAANNSTVTTATIDGNGNLILTRVNGTTVNAGRAKGDTGDTAPYATSSYGTVTQALSEATGPRTRRFFLSGTVTLTIPSATAGLSFTYTCIFVQDPTGGRTVVWPTNVKWPQGVKPSLSTAPNAVDVVHFFWTGAEWLGFTGGQAFA